MPDIQQMVGLDDGFLGVNARLDPGRVPEKFVCNARNRIFENQIIRNRWGVAQAPWGGKWAYQSQAVSLTAGSFTFTPYSPTFSINSIITSDPVNNRLAFQNGNRILSFSGSQYTMSKSADITTTSPLATIRSYFETQSFSDIVGILAYRDPSTGHQGLLVADNALRTSDKGQGRMYLVRPNQSHLEIPMNGYDFYDEVKLVQCGDAIVMLRPGPSRYYFSGAAASSSTNKITLNVIPDLKTGDRVIVKVIGPSTNLWSKASISSGAGFGLYVNVLQAVVSLHLTQGDANTGANPLAITSGLSSTDRYYIELQNNTTGNDMTQGLESYQNDGLPLIMQATYNTGTSKNVTALDSGFTRVPKARSIVAASATDDTITVPNHGFSAGDQVTISNVTGITGVTANNYYVYPTDANNLKLFYGATEETDSLNNATIATGTVVKNGSNGIASITINSQGEGYLTAPTVTIIDGGGTGATASATITNGVVTAVTITAAGSGYSGTPTCTFSAPSTLVDITATSSPAGTIQKFGASGASVPAGRTGLYFQNRLLMVFGNDYLAVSDVLDPLHYQAVSSEFKLNTGTNDRTVAIYPFNSTTLIVFKERSILAVENLYGDLSTVRLTEVTREFGCVAPNSIAATGSDIIFLSQRGVISLRQTESGISQSVILPLSDAIQPLINEIDESKHRAACGAYFANRYILSVPVENGDGTNQRTFTFNFLNQAWEGYWDGALLLPRYFERLVVAKDELLVWADESGFIHNFDPNALCDRTHLGVEYQISTSVTFRGYQAESTEHKRWTDLKFEFNTWNPEYDISTIYEGVSEEFVLATDVTKDRTAYYTYGAGTYNTTNSGDNFLARYRQDYSTKPVLQCGANGWKAGLHQGYMHKLKMRGHCATLQPKLDTSSGSVQVISCMVIGLPYRLYGKFDS